MTTEQAPTKEAATATEAAAPSLLSRKPVRIALLVVLGLLWIRFVLFAWAFPLVERFVDNPEFGDGEATEPADSGEAPVDPSVSPPG